MTSIDVIPATPALLERFYGRIPEKTSQSVVAVQGERVLGVAGIYREAGNAVAFTELSDEIRSNRRLIVRGYRALSPWIKAAGVPVFAICDQAVSGAETLLEHYGFKRVQEGIWQWLG